MSGRLCIFGEVLFDHFPDGKQVLGGAPFNVAWHLQAFGQSPLFYSRVGDDPEGDAVRTAMQDWGMDTSRLQTDTERSTGKVSIQFVDDEPVYDIVAQCAYDAIEAELAAGGCRLLYHGSLALREADSLHALEQLRSGQPEIVFMDVNLRPPWWQHEQILGMLQQADWVKLNAEELALLQAASGDELQAADFLAQYGLKGLVLTHGAKGAEVLTDMGERFEVRPDQDIEVVDTVGAGDAFASVIILGLVNDWPMDLTLQRAQAFACGLVAHRGATVSNAGFYQAFKDLWKLENQGAFD